LAKPQVEDGHIKIANTIGEALARVNLSAYESRVLWCIFRKTYGWNKKTDRISYSQFEEVTQLKRRHLGRTVKRLIERQIITCQGEGQQLEYGIQKDFDQWQDTPEPLPKEVTAAPASTITPIGNSDTPGNHYLFRTEPLPIQGEPLPKEVTKPLPKEVNTKAIKHITKDIIQKTGIVLELPDWVDKETFNAFLEMRKRQKAPPTEYAIKLLIKALDRFRQDGDDPNQILNQSIMNNWKGVFAIKNGGGKNDTASSYRGNPSQKPAGAFADL
jgi:phage replication O-like protein O